MKKERYWFQWDLDWRNKRLIDERLKKITADAQIKKEKVDTNLLRLFDLWSRITN